MKKILGIFSAFILLSLCVLGILAIWGEHPLSWLMIGRISLSVFLAMVGLLFLWLVYVLFFKREKYRAAKGKQAHSVK